MQQKYCKQEQIANADYVNNFMRVEHIISSCRILAKEQYIKSHDNDRGYGQLRFNRCKEIGVKFDNEHLYDHVIKLVETISVHQSIQ
jgi:hypothetical protein